MISVLLALPLWFSLCFLLPHLRHRAWYGRVEYNILRLAEKRPEGVSPAQWAGCLHWTWNLHSNFGGPTYFPESVRDPFLAEFERKLEGRVDLATIDWVWDEYGRHIRGTQAYSRNYRPTTMERLMFAAEDRNRELDLGWWLGELRRRAERR